MTKVLITGANGFSGKALVETLSQDAKNNLFLTDLTTNSSQHVFIPCNLCDVEEVRCLIQDIQPDEIYHLAGTFTNDYEVDYLANCLSARNILGALLEARIRPKVLLIGSAAEYGNGHPDERAVSESCQLNPVSIYGLTKVFQTQLMKFFVSNHSMDIAMARPFNLFGKGISTKLFVGRVYEQVQQVRDGIIQKIIVGSLKQERDYLHVTRAVSAYKVIMSKGQSGEVYNVGSGQPTKVSDLLDKILKEEGLDWSFVEEGSYSSSGVKTSFANISKFNRLKAGSLEC